MTLELSDLVVAVVAVIVGSFVKGVTGSGLPLISIPFMAPFLGVEHAVVIIALPSFLANIRLLWEHRHQAIAARRLQVLVWAGAGGAAFGTWVLSSADDRVLSLVLTGVIVLYAVVFLSRPEVKLPDAAARVLNPPVGLLAGVLQGATGISGPVVVTYLHSLRLEKSTYIFVVSTVYGVFGVVTMVSMVLLDLFTMNRLLQSLLIVVPMAVFLPIGILWSRRLSRRAFELAVLGLLLASAARLTWGALAG